MQSTGKKMAEKDASILPINITRGLTDKLVERRKGAALELERLVKDLVVMADHPQIKQVINTLKNDFTLSGNPNSRKGGLVGLAASAIALGRAAIGMNLPELVQPVLTCFEDPDARVRYYACESLYNISKVARGAVLVFFNMIFDGLCKLSSDSDSNVRYGAELLDRLMKDVVSENPHFDIDNFILLLRDRIYTHDGYTKQFLVSWIAFLDSVPDIHMHEHVQEFIDGLFCILGDQHKDIRRMTEDTMGELLKEIEHHHDSVHFEAMANIIAIHSQAEDAVIQFTALTWLKAFLNLAQRSMMVFTSSFLVSILPCVAYDSTSNKVHIRDVAFEVNDRLKKLILSEDDNDETTDTEDKSAFPTPRTTPRTTPQSSPLIQRKDRMAPSTQTGGKQQQQQTSTTKTTTGSSEKTDHVISVKAPEGQESNALKIKPQFPKEPPKLRLLPVLGVLIDHMKFTHEETRMETLRWLMWLHQQLPKRVYRQAGKLFPALLEILTDQYDRVVRMALQVVSSLSLSKGAQEVDPKDQHDTPAVSQTTTLVGSKTATTTSVLSAGKFGANKYKTVGSSSSRNSSPGPAAVVVPTPRLQLNKYFRMFLLELVKMFRAERSLLDGKTGSFIIRQLCVYVDAHSVYCTLAEILYAEDELGFASLMVQVLNMILFTATELYDFRKELKELSTAETWNLFTTLYRSWSHNPVATVALCLLTQNYDHASSLVQKFADIEITAGLLKEIDKLVQLIESPIFSFLRLQLLVPHEHASLVRTLYGLLMLLPQSTAFGCLKDRLSCVPVIMEVEQDVKTRRKKSHRQVPSNVSFDELLEYFVTVQKKHSDAKRESTYDSFRNSAITNK